MSNDARSSHVAIIPKNSVEDVRVTLSDYKGSLLVDVRTFANFNGGDEADRKATKKGISLKVDRLPALIEALREAARVAGIPGDAP